MRENKWNPDCLVRRSYNNHMEDEKYSGGDLTKDLHLWTAHRVMEWLRVINLAEYAPNLRGAGVHGALMVYEDRFNDELLADLLSIPATKSLIRRHLGKCNLMNQFKSKLKCLIEIFFQEPILRICSVAISFKTNEKRKLL